MLSQWFIWYCFVYMLMRLKKLFIISLLQKLIKIAPYLEAVNLISIHFPLALTASFSSITKMMQLEKLHYYNLHLIFQILTYGCVFMSLHASGSEWERWGKNRRLRHEWIGKFVAPIANFFEFVTNEKKKSTHAATEKEKKKKAKSVRERKG